MVSYTYSFDWRESVTVPADGDGTAWIDWTPADSGFHDLKVYATTGDGVQLAEYEYFFSVT